MRQFRVALLMLASSPALMLVAIFHTLAAFAMSWLFLIGCLALLGPLVYLSFRKSPFLEKPTPRRVIRLAAASSLVALLGIGMVEAPDYLIASDSSPPAIKFGPPTPDMPDVIHVYGEYVVSGLNVRFPPCIEPGSPGVGYRFRVTVVNRGGASSSDPPGRLRDGYGNHVTFSEPEPGVLRLEDELGGFAEIDWTGSKPILVASRAFPRTPSARGPTAIALRIRDAGEFVLLFSLLIAWMLLTMALARVGAFSSIVLPWSLRLQQVGLGICALSCLIVSAWPPTDNANQDLVMFVGSCCLMPAALVSVVGLAMMSISLIQFAWTWSD